MSVQHKNASTYSAVALLLASLLGAAPSARANDWASLGLDNGRGRATDERSGAAFSPAWNASPSGGAFVASPAVVDGFVVVAGAKGDVSALRAIDGTLAWTVKTAGAIGASPAVDKGRIFVPNLTGKLQALSLGTGTEVWTQAFGGQNYGSPAFVSDGLGASLVLAAGFPQQKVVRLSTSTGAVQWETARDAVAGLVSSSAAVGAGQILFGMNGGRYQSLDPLTGLTTWRADAKGSVGLSGPLVVGTTAYFLPGGSATALYAANAATGELSAGWPVVVNDPSAPLATAYASQRNIVSSPALLGSLVVFVARFEYDLKPNANGTAGKHLLREYLVAVDPAAATVAWQQEIGRLDALSINEIPELNLSPTPASFATATDPLVAVTSSIAPQVALFDIGGKQVWSASLSAPTRSSPVFANGMLLVATDAGVVHAFSSDVNHAPAAPADGFEPAEGGFVEGSTPTLQWAAAQDAEAQPLRYQVRVMGAGDDLYGSPLTQLDTDAGQAQVKVPSGLLKGGSTYSYAVRSRDDQGAWSGWSVPRTFVAAITAKIEVAGKEYDTLDAAVSAVPATGGTVDIGRGLLYLQAPLQVPAGVTISGVSPHDTILQATGIKAGVQLTSGGRTGAPALKNLTVTGAEVGVQIVDVQNAILRNIVVRDNKKAGVQVEEGAIAEAINVTLARNGAGAVVAGKLNLHSSLVVLNDTGLARSGLGLVTSRYNDVFANKTTNYQDVEAGTGDISVAVTFRSTADFHLAGLQPTTDHGDPSDGFALEPAPNGARVNMGAFGNTATAELSESTSGWTPTAGAKVGVPAGPSPVGDTPTHAPGGGGSGCAVGGTGAPGSAAWLLLAAVGAMLVARRRRT
jgi:MYXO-CTERM domain-containing protein